MTTKFGLLFNHDLLLVMTEYMETMDRTRFTIYLESSKIKLGSKISISQNDSIRGLNKNDIEVISSLTNLKHLDLGINIKYLGYDIRKDDIDNYSMSDIAKLTDLTYLNLNNKYKITSEGLILLAKLTNLKTLELSKNLNVFGNTNLTDFNFHIINSFLTNLTSLKFNSIQVLDINSISNLRKIETLNVYNMIINNPEPPESFLNLKSLKIRNPENYFLDILGRLTNLTSLELSWKGHIENYNFIINLTNLEILDMTRTETNDINYLTHLTQLKDLTLSSINNINDSTPLLFLTNLEKFAIGYLNTSNDLRYLTNLKDLDINSSKNIKSYDLSFLTKLEKLSLIESEIDNLLGFETLRNLTDLNLSVSVIHDTNSIENLTNLKILNLSDTNFDKMDILVELTNLESLEINDPLQHINILIKIPSLKKIAIYGSNITDNSLLEISHILTLEDLTIDGVENITDLGIKYLSRLPKLKILRIYYSDFNIKHKSLLSLPKLEELHLRINFLTFDIFKLSIPHDVLEIKQYTEYDEDTEIIYLNPAREIIPFD